MIPDLMHLLLPLWVLRKARTESYTTRPFYRDKNIRRDVVAMLGAVAFLFLICSLL